MTAGSGIPGVWTQSWTLSVVDGFVCADSFLAVALLEIEGSTSSVSEVFYLPTGVTTRVDSWSEISYSTLTPQIAMLVQSLPLVTKLRIGSGGRRLCPCRRYCHCFRNVNSPTGENAELVIRLPLRQPRYRRHLIRRQRRCLPANPFPKPLLARLPRLAGV